MNNSGKILVAIAILTTIGVLVYSPTYDYFYPQIEFDVLGVSTDYNGVLLILDGVNYKKTELPLKLRLNRDSQHSFAYNTPLIVNEFREYLWATTSGLSKVQGETIKITDNGSKIIAQYTNLERADVLFDQQGIEPDYSQTILTVDGIDLKRSDLPKSFRWLVGSDHSYSYNSPLEISIMKKYNWDTSEGLSTLKSNKYNVISGGGKITGKYSIELPPLYAVKFNQIGISSNYTEAVATVDGKALTLQDLPYNINWMKYTNHTFSFTSPLVTENNQYVWVQTNGITTAKNGTIRVTSPGEIVAKFTEEKLAKYVNIVFNQTGVNPGFIESVLTVDDKDLFLIDLPYTAKWVQDSNHTYSYKQNLGVGENERSFWSTTTGIVNAQSGIIKASSDNYVTANFVTQYSISFRASGFKENVEGIVVTVRNSRLEDDELPYRIWVNENSSVDYQYSSRVYSVLDGKRYLLTDVSTPSVNKVTGPIRVSGSYNKIEYSTTFYANNIEKGDSTTVITVNGNSVMPSSMPYTYWSEVGETITYDGALYVYDWDQDLRSKKLDVSGPASPLTVSGPNKVTFDYGKRGTSNIELLVNFQSGGSISTSTVTYQIGAQSETTKTTPFHIWIPYGSNISFSYQTSILVGVGREYYLEGVNNSSPIAIYGPQTMIGTYNLAEN